MNKYINKMKKILKNWLGIYDIEDKLKDKINHVEDLIRSLSVFEDGELLSGEDRDIKKGWEY